MSNSPISLKELKACFEGVIPAIIASAGTDGVPNVSYLSHVMCVDDSHVALSNQFFAKTAANIRANPNVALLLVDGKTGHQFVLDIRWDRTEDWGKNFDEMDRILRMSIAQTHMANVMRLRSVDIFRVLSITACEDYAPICVEPRQGALEAMDDYVDRLSQLDQASDPLTTLLQGSLHISGADAAMVLLRDEESGCLVVTGSAGYSPSGVGSEIEPGEGLINEVAKSGQTLRINDLSRMRRMSGAVSRSLEHGVPGRTILLPRLDNNMSQIAIPLRADGEIKGVLFVESRSVFNFDEEAGEALEKIAAAAMQAFEHLPLAADTVPEPQAVREQNVPLARFTLVHYAFDNSVFIDDRYVIKGVAGRLLVYLAQKYLSERRTDFTNREVRLAPELKLPDYKDNLEARLILLRRRLEDLELPVRIERAGRGQMRLVLEAAPQIVSR